MHDDVTDIIDITTLRSAPANASMEDKVDWIIEQLGGQELMQEAERQETRSRHARAIAIREQTEMEVVSKTKALCEAMTYEAGRRYEEAERTLDEARQVKSQAEREYEEMMSQARSAAQQIIQEAQAEAERERGMALKEARTLMARAESIKAATEDELESQRILTNALEMKVNSANWNLSQSQQWQPEAPAYAHSEAHEYSLEEAPSTPKHSPAPKKARSTAKRTRARKS